MTRKKKAALAALAVVLLVAAALSWKFFFHRERDSGQLVLYGNIDIRQVSLAFNASERIAQLLVQEGDRVKAGQLLGTLDVRTLELRARQARAQIDVRQQELARLQNGSRPEEVQQAQAKVRAAQAEAELAAKNLERLQGTSRATEGQGVAKTDLDSAQARAHAARAELESAKKAAELVVKGPRKEDIAQAQAQLAASRAELALMERQLAEGELKSPVDAVVRSRLMEPGDMASPARPVYTLAITQPKWVRAYVAEPDLHRVKPGEIASVLADGIGEAVRGQVGYISSVAEFTPKNVQTEELRTNLVYEVRVNVEDAQDRLRLGQPVTVRLQEDGAQ